jgi:hypothetical protein
MGWDLAGKSTRSRLRVVAEGVDELADFVAFAVGLLRGLARELLVKQKLFFRLVWLAELAIGLSEAVVGFLTLRIELNRSFVSRNCRRIVSGIGVQNAKLEVRSRVLGIQASGGVEQVLDFGKTGAVRRRLPALP